MKSDVILSAADISVVKEGKEILNVPAFSVETGEFVAVTGPNGSGKSTLLRTLGFLESPYSGSITFDGDRITGAKGQLTARRKMAMVFQDPLLLRGSVLENVTIGLKLRGISKTERVTRARFWLERLRISQFHNRDVRTLSGGEAQRVSLARAFALEPQVLFLDEPFTYLDAPTKASLVSELKEILRETNTTALMVTHDFNDIPFLADRMLVLMEGRIRQSGPVEKILFSPASRAVAEFLAIENIWEGRVNNRAGRYYFTARDESASFELLPEQAKQVEQKGESEILACLRPEHVIFYGDGLQVSPDADDIPNMITGTIETVQPYGYYYKIKIRAGIELTALISTAQFHKNIKPGNKISVILPSDRICLIVDS